MKIINTIKGVLVRMFWNTNDLINQTLDNLDFIFHWKKNKQEAEDFEKELLSFQKEREKFKLEIQEQNKEYDDLLKLHAKDKNRISDLEINNVTKTNRITVLESRLQDVNNQYIEVFHNYTNTSVALDKLQESFNKVRGRVGGLTRQNNKLKKENQGLTFKLVSAREELIKSKNKIKFIESKLPKKTLEEIVAYTYSQKEVLKRSKKNEQ